MAVCPYCHKKLGWIAYAVSSAHEQCERAHQACLQSIQEKVKEALALGESYESISQPIQDYAVVGFATPAEVKEAVQRGWSEGAELRALQSSFDYEDMNRLTAFNTAAGIQMDQVAHCTGFFAALYRLRLESLVMGEIPITPPTFSFNVLPNETPFASFAEVQYGQEVTTRNSRGTYSGISLPVWGGLRYSTGGYKSHIEEHTDLKLIDTGRLLLTTLNIYFAGQHKAIRVPYGTIVTFKPYSNGLGFFRSGGPLEVLFVVKPEPYVGNFLFGATEYLSSPRARVTGL